MSLAGHGLGDSHVRLDLPTGNAAAKIVPLIFEPHDGRALAPSS
jgi:hypothetical protein